MQNSVHIKQRIYLRQQKRNALEPYVVVISRGTCQREEAGPFESKRDMTRKINEENEAVVGVKCQAGGRVVEGYVAGGVVWGAIISSALFCVYSFLLSIFIHFYARKFTQ